MNEKKEIPATEMAPSPPRESVQDPKAAREARGLSLKDVFETTRVSMNNLEALENGDFHLLPPPVYTKNFIRKYARAVGIDEKPLLSRYEKHLESLNPPREDPGVQKPWPETGRQYRFLFGSLAIVIVAGILVYALFLYDQSGKTIPPAAPSGSTQAQQAKPEPVVTTEPTVSGAADPTAAHAPAAPAASAAPATPTAPVLATTARPTPVPQGGSTPGAGRTPVAPSGAVPGKMLHLVIEARELSWVRITEDRNPPYQVLLKQAERIERLATDYFLVDIGNAGGVNLIFQGKPLGILGKQGQVIHLRLPEKPQDKRSP